MEHLWKCLAVNFVELKNLMSSVELAVMILTFL